jgi:hypothetical protein
MKPQDLALQLRCPSGDEASEVAKRMNEANRSLKSPYAAHIWITFEKPLNKLLHSEKLLATLPIFR